MAKEVMYNEEIVVEMVTLTCGVCGVNYAMSRPYYDAKLKSGADFYCLNGHVRYFSKEPSAAEIELKKALRDKENLRLQLNWANNQKTSLVKDLNSERGKRGAVVRKLNKLKKGHCPECDKYFSNIREHMDHKHKDFDADNLKE